MWLMMSVLWEDKVRSCQYTVEEVSDQPGSVINGGENTVKHSYSEHAYNESMLIPFILELYYKLFEHNELHS